MAVMLFVWCARKNDLYGAPGSNSAENTKIDFPGVAVFWEKADSNSGNF